MTTPLRKPLPAQIHISSGVIKTQWFGKKFALAYAACCALAVATGTLSYQFYQERHKTTDAALIAAPLLPLPIICPLLMRDSA